MQIDVIRRYQSNLSKAHTLAHRTSIIDLRCIIFMNVSRTSLKQRNQGRCVVAEEIESNVSSLANTIHYEWHFGDSSACTLTLWIRIAK